MVEGEDETLRVEEEERVTELLGETVLVMDALRLRALLGESLVQPVAERAAVLLTAPLREAGTDEPVGSTEREPSALEKVEDTLGLKLTLGDPEGGRVADTVRVGGALRDIELDPEGEKDTEGERVNGAEASGELLTEGELLGRTLRVDVVVE